MVTTLSQTLFLTLLNQLKARQALNTAALQAQHVPDESEEEDTMEELSTTS